MIGYIRGQKRNQWGQRIIIDVNGVGYEIQMPSSSITKLPASGNEIMVFTHLVWKDDMLSLYGFETVEARDMFRMLLEVSGVGPRLALNILSILTPGELLQTLAKEENKRLQVIQGIGEKTAARLCIDLKEKAKSILTKKNWDVESLPSNKQVDAKELWNDALSALTHLGYSPSETKVALAKVFASSSEGIKLEDLVKKTLQGLAKNHKK
jgi:Holliday junction DNA helicase RuvA